MAGHGCEVPDVQRLRGGTRVWCAFDEVSTFGQVDAEKMFKQFTESLIQIRPPAARLMSHG
jgi:hypothetical protein